MASRIASHRMAPMWSRLGERRVPAVTRNAGDAPSPTVLVAKVLAGALLAFAGLTFVALAPPTIGTLVVLAGFSGALALIKRQRSARPRARTDSRRRGSRAAEGVTPWPTTAQAHAHDDRVSNVRSAKSVMSYDVIYHVTYDHVDVPRRSHSPGASRLVGVRPHAHSAFAHGRRLSAPPASLPTASTCLDSASLLFAAPRSRCSAARPPRDRLKRGGRSSRSRWTTCPCTALSRRARRG